MIGLEFLHLFEIFWFVVLGVAFWHSLQKQSLLESLLFFIPALLWGFIAEYAGVTLYDFYSYSPDYFL